MFQWWSPVALLEVLRRKVDWWALWRRLHKPSMLSRQTEISRQKLVSLWISSTCHLLHLLLRFSALFLPQPAWGAFPSLSTESSGARGARGQRGGFSQKTRWWWRLRSLPDSHLRRQHRHGAALGCGDVAPQGCVSPWELLLRGTYAVVLKPYIMDFVPKMAKKSFTFLGNQNHSVVGNFPCSAAFVTLFSPWISISSKSVHVHKHIQGIRIKKASRA